MPPVGFTVLLLLLGLIGSVRAYCSQGSEWIEYNGNCYYWQRSNSNWFNAELTCKKFGGHLVSIKSAAENDFLHRMTQCRTDFWTGLVNTVHSLKGQTRGYEWWDGSPHNYTMLAQRTNDYYDCVFFHSNTRWYNYVCQYSYNYICMSPAEAGPPQRLPHQKPEQSRQALANAGDNQGTQQNAGFEDSDQLDGSQHQQGNEAVWYWTTDYPDWGTTVPDSNSTPSPTAPPAKCPPGWQLMDSSCYMVSANRTNYFNAQMSCQAKGASVASVLTRREHTLLNIALGCNSPAWIGLEKARPCFKQPSKNYCWVWMDRSPVVYLDWASGQNVDKRDFECVIIDGQWKLMNCYAEYRYVCKRPAYGGNAVQK